jgi:hypothetical protein
MADGEILDADTGCNLVLNNTVRNCRDDAEGYNLEELHQ